MRFNPKARLDTDRVRDTGRGGGGGMGGSPMRLPIPGGTKAGGGIGTILLMVVLFVVANCMGLDLNGGGGGSAAQPDSQSGQDTSRMGDDTNGRYAECKTGEDANKSSDCARIAVENSLYDFWADDFEKDGQQLDPAQMTTFSGSVNTGCGQATSQVGPFYCPADKTIYLDTTFFEQVLQGQLGGPEGEFVEPYVIGHEYGHHIQNLAGIMNKVKTQQGPNSDAVKLELQADCFAGAWTAGADGTQDDSGTQAIFDGEIPDEDVRTAIEAAAAVGDDRIQEKTQGQVNPESWTHGSAEQRMESFKIGYQGTPNDCLAVGPQ